MINGNDLIKLGWKPSKEMGEAIAKAKALSNSGLSDEEILSREEFIPPKEVPKIAMSSEASRLGVALDANNEVEEHNKEVVISQMTNLLKCPKIIGGAIMPDACPTGTAPANITVGGAIEVDNAIIPSAHSADICCSMFSTFFKSDLPVKAIMDNLVASTRFGPGGRSRSSGWVDHSVLHTDLFETNDFLKDLKDHARKHMADQGDGNHFLYLGKLKIDSDLLNNLQNNGYSNQFNELEKHYGEELYIIVSHHGSRGLGAQLYKRGIKEAQKYMKKIAVGIPDNAAWLDYDTDIGKEYWEALQYVSDWTRANHESIHTRFLEKSKTDSILQIGNEHNFVWKRGNSFFHGKGATPAWKDEQGRSLLGLIPLNMGEEILLVLGGDNEKYLSFAPHGAGRNVSRTTVIKDFRHEDGRLNEEAILASIEEQTKGLDIRWYGGKPDISETPLAYKNADEVRNQIEKYGLAKVIGRIQPVGCIMAGEIDKPWLKKKKKEV